MWDWGKVDTAQSEEEGENDSLPPKRGMSRQGSRTETQTGRNLDSTVNLGKWGREEKRTKKNGGLEKAKD